MPPCRKPSWTTACAGITSGDREGGLGSYNISAQPGNHEALQGFKHTSRLGIRPLNCNGLASSVGSMHAPICGK